MRVCVCISLIFLSVSFAENSSRKEEVEDFLYLPMEEILNVILVLCCMEELDSRFESRETRKSCLHTCVQARF